MEEGEQDVDPSTLKDNPMAIEREVLGPPFLFLSFSCLSGFFG